MLVVETAEWSPRFESRSMPGIEWMRVMADQPAGIEASYALRDTGHATPAPHLGPCRR
jgi:hypothetical protein